MSIEPASSELGGAIDCNMNDQAVFKWDLVIKVNLTKLSQHCTYEIFHAGFYVLLTSNLELHDHLSNIKKRGNSSFTTMTICVFHPMFSQDCGRIDLFRSHRGGLTKSRLTPSNSPPPPVAVMDVKLW